MSAIQIQNITGWSRATFQRRSKKSDFPTPKIGQFGRKLWNPLEIYEWISRFNLEILMDRESYLQFERDLNDKAFANPLLRTAYGRIVEREIARRNRLGDGN